MKTNFTPTLGVSLLAFSTVMMMAGATLAAPTDTVPVAANQIMESGLAADAVVPNATITLEAKRLPLSQLLSQVQEQSKITFTIAPDAFAREPKVTLAVAQMPLREWMDALSKLYDVHWVAKGDNAFELRASGRSANARGLRRMGLEYDYWGWSYRQNERPDYLPPRPQPDFKGIVDDNLDLEALNTTGVAWKDAPPALQKAARERVEHEVATQLLLDALTLDVATGPLAVKFAKPPGGASWTIGGKTSFTPYPVSAIVSGRYGLGVTLLDMVPSERGHELLRDKSIFAPQAPTVTEVAQPLPQDPQNAR